MQAQSLGYSATLRRDHLERFKRGWPCHGLPELASICFAFDGRGDLVDIVARYRNGRPADTSKFDGPALVALCEEAQRMMHPEHADLRYGRAAL